MINLNRKKYRSDKLESNEWASILQQDGRSLMIRSLDVSQITLETISTLRNQYTGGVSFEKDIDSEQVISQLKQPGKVSMDAGIGYYFLKNPESIPQAWEGKFVHFPGTILCHEPYTRFWEPHSVLQLYQNKFEDGTKAWWHTYVNLHVLCERDLFAFLPESARHESDIIVKSFIDDRDPDEQRF